MIRHYEVFVRDSQDGVVKRNVSLPCEPWLKDQKGIDPKAQKAQKERVREVNRVLQRDNRRKRVRRALARGMTFDEILAANPDMTSGTLNRDCMVIGSRPRSQKKKYREEVLHHIRTSGPVTVGDCAAFCGISYQAARTHVFKLVDDGLAIQATTRSEAQGATYEAVQ